MYKVFTDNRIIFFTETLKKSEALKYNDKVADIEPFSDKYTFADYPFEGKKNVVFLCDEPKRALQNFFKDHIVVEAAGGLVKNAMDEYLVIFRNGMWDLPKGKIETGESKEEAAVREVEEECGLNGVKIIKPLLTTYHTYDLHDKKVIKPSHWYLMSYQGNKSPKPQTEEGITTVKWVSQKELRNIATLSYLSIQDVIEEYLQQVDVK